MSLPNKKEQQDERARIGLRASLVGLVANALLAASKIVAGSLSGSVSILADGINNLSDSGSVLISWFSLRIAQKPGDRDHPFGHGRAEYIGSLAIAVVILYVGLDLLKSSIQAILSPLAPQFSWWVACITALSIPAKVFLWVFYKKRGKEYNLSALSAAAQDSFNDILITSAVLVGLFASHYYGILADGWLGVLVSLFILWSGVGLIRGTSSALIGGKPDRKLGGRILEIIKKYPEITGVHDFVLHDYGPGRSMASIHAEVDANARLLDIHDIIDQAEQEILRELNLPITIHMDPTLPDGAPGKEIKASIEKYLEQLDPPLTLHDFRMVPGRKIIKLIFDIAVPADYHEDGLIDRVSAYAKSFDIRHQCIIQLDRDYFVQKRKADE